MRVSAMGRGAVGGTVPTVPLLVLMLGFFVLPLASLFLYSFYTHVPGQIMSRVFTLANYMKFVRDLFFWNALWVTIKIGLATTVCTLLIGYPLAYYFARSSFHRGLQLALLVSPLLVNIVIRVYGWRVLLSDVGLINKLLMGLGLVSYPVQFMNNTSGVIVALVHVLLPHMVLSISGVLEGISTSLEEAAATLGANGWVVFKRVLLPLSIPGIVSGSILVFTSASGSFIVPALMGGGRVKTIPTLMHQYTLGLLNWPFGATLAFVMAALTLVSLSMFSRITLKSTRAREEASE